MRASLAIVAESTIANEFKRQSVATQARQARQADARRITQYRGVIYAVQARHFAEEKLMIAYMQEQRAKNLAHKRECTKRKRGGWGKILSQAMAAVSKRDKRLLVN